MNFNVKPNLDMVNAIKTAQTDGLIQKSEILEVANGSITAYNPMCLFKTELQEKIIETDEKCGDNITFDPVLSLTEGGCEY